MNSDPVPLIKKIETPEDFASFVAVLADEANESSEDWYNVSLNVFLEAMSAWISDSLKNPDSGGYKHLREGPSWKCFATILAAATIYE